MTDNDTDAKQRTVDVFNANHLPGAWVRYWTGTRQDPAKYGQTRSRAELLSGHTPVVWVTTHGACIALTHVDPIPGQPDEIEDDSHDLPKLAGATERVGDYIAANGDGIYDVLDGHPLYARDLEALRQAAGHVWIGEQLRDEVEKLRAALTQSREQAATYANEIGTLTAENARVRQQRDEVAADLALAVEDRNKMKAKLDGPCGSCHPCTNYRDETWRAANRKPPHVIDWDDAQAEMKALRAVVAGAKVWRQWYGNTNPTYASACNDLAAAVDALPNPDNHLPICPGFDCPGCREDEPTEAEAVTR